MEVSRHEVRETCKSFNASGSRRKTCGRGNLAMLWWEIYMASEHDLGRLFVRGAVGPRLGFYVCGSNEIIPRLRGYV